MRILFVFFMLYANVFFGDIKAYLFDCDGTLVDSEYTHYLGWKHALSTLGGDLQLEEYYQYVGQPTEKVARQLSDKIGKSCSEVLIKIKRERYSELTKTGLPPIHPTVNFLKLIAANKQSTGIKIGVCSSAKKKTILSNLKHLGIEHLIDLILSGQDDLDAYSDPEGVNKPKPYIYLHAMKLLGISPNETVVIEDSAPGLKAAISAGCFAIAVPNEYTKHHDFSRANLLLKTFDNLDEKSFTSMISERLNKRTINRE